MDSHTKDTIDDNYSFSTSTLLRFGIYPLEPTDQHGTGRCNRASSAACVEREAAILNQDYFAKTPPPNMFNILLDTARKAADCIQDAHLPEGKGGTSCRRSQTGCPLRFPRFTPSFFVASSKTSSYTRLFGQSDAADAWNLWLSCIRSLTEGSQVQPSPCAES
ncbi:hypothetical protein CKAH01_08151 [Colletotrichum kahawae]|uniref:Uncharacterized protein n=1 Tax=Colletotrichum kahawae TaxID=34407 RepID=A0AAD9Y3B0_COLKA|nr:hypothetical protein CKAH01_08151 [Colletotrichum kahawae]